MNKIAGLFYSYHNEFGAVHLDGGVGVGEDKEFIFRNGIDNFDAIRGFKDLELPNLDISEDSTALNGISGLQSTLMVKLSKDILEEHGHGWGVISLQDNKFLVFRHDSEPKCFIYEYTSAGLSITPYDGPVTECSYDEEDSYDNEALQNIE